MSFLGDELLFQPEHQRLSELGVGSRSFNFSAIQWESFNTFTEFSRNVSEA